MCGALAVAALLAAQAPAAGWGDEPPVIVDATGVYERGSFEYERPDGTVISGRATLEVRGGDFTLTPDGGAPISGTIYLAIANNNYTIGLVSLEGGPLISVGWENPWGDVFKIIRVEAERRRFRFCSQSVRKKHCRKPI
jgi:hypothetical protein